MTGAALAIIALAAAGAQHPPRVLRLDAASPFVEATLNKVPVRLRVDLAAHERILIDRGFAEKMKLTTVKHALLALTGLREGGVVDLRIGPIQREGHWAGAKLQLGDTGRDVQVAWFDYDDPDEADGVVSPALLPFDEVVLVRRAPGVADRELAVPVELDGWHGLVTKAKIGRTTVDVSFSLADPTTVATAAAGQALADIGRGARTGPTWREPIALGVARPVRAVRLSDPVAIAGFRLAVVPVRVSDWAGEGDPPPDADLPSDEVAVEARGKRQRAWASLTLGQDRLSACAQVAYRRRPAQVRLTCRFDASPPVYRVGAGSGPE